MRPLPADADDFLLTEPLTSLQLNALRVKAVWRWLEEQGAPVPVFTCTNCTMQTTCALAYDDYNTDGACLLEK